jgi:hypothetical protein
MNLDRLIESSARKAGPGMKATFARGGNPERRTVITMKIRMSRVYAMRPRRD